jgi:folate-binding protein YgfZ
VIATTEYERLREAVGMVDRSFRGKLMLRGADASEFLQGQLTNDIEALAPGGGCYAALLSHKGKMRADLRVLRGADWVWLDTESETLGVLKRTIETYSLGREVRLEDVSGARAMLSLIGPSTDGALDVAPPGEEHAFVEGDHGLYVRTDVGVDVICAAESIDDVRAALGVEAVSEASAECVRIETGRPRYGLDIGPETIPQEAGLNARAVSFDKGCYVGQETVARLFYKGKPNRHLRGLRLSAPVATGQPLRLGEREVGVVGSTCVSPAHGPIALALVRREAGPGQVLRVAESDAEAEVVELPFAAPS